MSTVKLSQKTCTKCDTYMSGAGFFSTKSKFFADGTLPICKLCLAEMVDKVDWMSMDKLCQWADYPFYPEVWTKLSRELGVKALAAYVNAYTNTAAYEGNDWKEVQTEWAELLRSGKYKDRIPEISEDKLAELEYVWGKGYEHDELTYMETFFKGMNTAHNIITETQKDAARTLAKLSVRISQKISRGEDVDKDIGSYDKFMKIGGFTTENIRNMSDFESVGEVIAYLERTGWVNPYFDGVAKDIVDTTMLNMQAYTRRVIMGEVSLKDQAERRLATLGLNEAGDVDLSEEEFAKYDDDAYMDIEVNIANDDEPEEMTI